jgi:hypothetical protein
MKNLKFIPLLAIIALFCSNCKIQNQAKEISEKIKQTTVNDTTFKAEIPFEAIDNTPIIDVVIEGKTYKFLLATGILGCFISEELSKALPIAALTKTKQKNKQGEMIDRTYAQLPKIEIGGVAFYDVLSAVNDDVSRSYKCVQLDGLIGANLLSKAVWQIDYPNQKIRFTNHRDSLFLGKDKQIIPFYSKNNTGISIPTASLRINYNFIGDVIFDTGDKNAVDFPKSMHKSISDTSQNVSFLYQQNAGKLALLPTLTIGEQLHLKEVWIGRTDRSVARIGGVFFRNYTVTFDWKNQQVILTNDQKQIFETFGCYYSLSKADGVRIGSVVKNSQADKVGLKAGELIVKINDHDVSDISQADFCSITKSNKNKVLTLSVKRGDEILTYTFDKVPGKTLAE